MTKKVEILVMKQLSMLMESTSSSYLMIENIANTLKKIED